MYLKGKVEKESYKKLIKKICKRKSKKPEFLTTDKKFALIKKKLFKKYIKKIKEVNELKIEKFFDIYIFNSKNLTEKELLNNYDILVKEIKENLESIKNEKEVERIQLDAEHDEIIYKILGNKMYPLFKVIDFIWKKKKLKIEDLELCDQYHYFLLGSILDYYYKFDLEFSNHIQILKSIETLQELEINKTKTDLIFCQIFQMFFKYLENKFNLIFHNFCLNNKNIEKFLHSKNKVPVCNYISFLTYLEEDQNILKIFKDYLFFLPNIYLKSITKKIFTILLDINLSLSKKSSFEHFQKLLTNLHDENMFKFPLTIKEMNFGINLLLKTNTIPHHKKKINLSV